MQTIVAKFGSTTLSVPNRGLDYDRIERHVDNLLSVPDTQLVIVTSGAVAAGGYKYGQSRPEMPMPSDQVLAGIGANIIVQAWSKPMEERGVLVSGALVTHHEIEDTNEKRLLRTFIQDSFQAGVVPVINENDAVADKELKLEHYGGENDGLASHIARFLGADALVLFTNNGGFYNETNQLIKKLTPGTDKKWAINLARERELLKQQDDQARRGTGGMVVKLTAAFDAAEAGIEVYIAAPEDHFTEILDGQFGTHIAKVE